MAGRGPDPVFDCFGQSVHKSAMSAMSAVIAAPSGIWKALGPAIEVQSYGRGGKQAARGMRCMLVKS